MAQRCYILDNKNCEKLLASKKNTYLLSVFANFFTKFKFIKFYCIKPELYTEKKVLKIELIIVVLITSGDSKELRCHCQQSHPACPGQGRH